MVLMVGSRRFHLRQMLLVDADFYVLPTVVVGADPTWGCALTFKSGGEVRAYFQTEREWKEAKRKIDDFLSGRAQCMEDREIYIADEWGYWLAPEDISPPKEKGGQN